MSHDPIAAKHAKWFQDNFENGLTKQLHLRFDPVLTSAMSILYRRDAATLKDAEAVTAWLEHAKFKFRDGVVSKATPYCKVSERASVDGQYVYFVVQLYARGSIIVKCVW